MMGGDPKIGMTERASDNSSSSSLPESQEVLPSIRGVKIVEFLPDSRAREAGMQRGDIIVEYDG